MLPFEPIDTEQFTYRELVTYLNKQQCKMRYGSTRRTWIFDTFVVKLPRIVARGYNALNVQEYDNYCNGITPIAHCILTYTRDSVAIVQMEKVTDYYTIHKTYRNIPVWAKRVDSYQIGYTSDNRLVAYDHTCCSDSYIGKGYYDVNVTTAD